MPERGFDTGFWTEDFVMELTYPAKHLFHYLGSNDHCNQAGVYHIVPKTIAFESGLPESDLPTLLKMLEPEVKWLPGENVVWVKNFVAHQAKSPKFLIAAAKCLKNIRNNGLVAEVVEYNLAHYTISIPYAYPTDRVSIPPVSVSVSVSSSVKEIGVVKGKGKTELAASKDIPRSRTETEETLCEGDQEVISTLRSVKNFSLEDEGLKELVARMRTEFPDVDILAECKTWAARKLEEPLGPKTRAAAQLWNWMRKARQFAQEKHAQGRVGRSRSRFGSVPTEAELDEQEREKGLRK